jgi:hypothetical protein
LTGSLGEEERMTDKAEYVTNRAAVVRGPRKFELELTGIERAVHRTRSIVRKFAGFEIDVFSILGMRNLSAFVGEVFAAALVTEYPGILAKNPHQDGYPDLLLLDEAGEREWVRVANRIREKSPFSPYVTGGFEVKATCGAVPSPEVCRRRGMEKPDIGDQRLKLLSGYDWKSHHRETNDLFGVFWDFVDGCPTIVAVFYRSDLTVEDWGAIVHPRAGGGRTTSVSIMTRSGVRKMYEGWVIVLKSTEYARFFDGRNNGLLLSRAVAR